MIILQNDFLIVKIAELGAELKSVADINNPYEYMWQGEAPFWKRTAPVLFPIVGALKDKTYYYQGQAYTMGQHGFARDCEFQVVSQDEQQVTLELRATEATKKNYPFDFTLKISYILNERVLAVGYQVENPSTEETLWFSIGAHPAFNAELLQGTCEILFEQPENLNTEIIDLERGLIKREFRPMGDQADSLRLSPSVFDQDALIFGHLKSRYVAIQNATSNRRIAMSLVGVPKLGIWTDKGPFVCLEPWWGIADYVDTNQKLEDKEMIKNLKPGNGFQCGYDIAFE